MKSDIKVEDSREMKRFLKGQDLAGVLPPALVKLPYLKTVCICCRDISMNNISGAIPSFLGNITTLKNLFMSNNLLSGTVAHELGKLVNLENLILSANYLTGELPVNLTNLIKLKEIRFSSNNFTGRMPDFFRSWKQLNQLEIRASGFEGPIPSSISVLSDLTDLRIGDIVGEGSKFPNLSSMTGMSRLDLSFNQLDGTVPNFDVLKNLTFMYLTNNLLTGAIPDWVKNRDDNYQIDLSYNNFTESPAPPCRETLYVSGCWSFIHFAIFSNYVKLTFSSLASEMSSKVLLEGTTYRYSLHINCGGKATIVGNIQYEEDEDSAGAAKFDHGRENWGFSSTGHFWDEKLEWKDFDIENSARGVDKAVVVEYKANVTNRNLMILFYWAGKGTTFTPMRAIFGPLISAISVESDFVLPDHEDGTMKISIVVGAIVLGILSDGTVIAIKQLSSKSKQGSCEFVNEIGMISGLQHPNLVRLYGSCIEGKQLLLVYEYMENNSLAHALFGNGFADGQLKLDWPARDLNPKISDFGLAKLDEEEITHISTRIAGKM
nr:probable LRR receptor-like serine/threonine-protein kinase At1g53420 [Quercus suber]